MVYLVYWLGCDIVLWNDAPQSSDDGHSQLLSIILRYHLKTLTKIAILSSRYFVITDEYEIGKTWL